MDVINLDMDNVQEYEVFLTEDIAENIGRSFYHGLVVTENNTTVAGIVWEIQNIMTDKNNESRIVFLKIDDERAAEVLFENYKAGIMQDDVVTSNFSLSAKSSEKERAALKNAGFTVKLMEGDLIKARLSEVAGLAFIQKVKTSDNIRPLNTITQRGFNAGVRRFVMMGMFGLCEDIAYLPRSYFENDVSCYCETDGQIDGLLLFHKNPSGGLVVVIMAAAGKDSNMLLLRMIRQAVSSAVEIYPPETEVWIDRHNYASLALSEKLFPRGFGTPVYVGSRQEKV